MEILGLAILVNFYTHWFNPFNIQLWKAKQVNKLVTWLIDKELWWLQSLLRVLWCEKCLAFWSGLVIFQNVFAAAITSLLAYLIKQLLIFLNEWNG